MALIALFAGWVQTADIANATTYEDIAGQWCGDVTDYVFTLNTLIVKFHDDRPANVFEITKYTYINDSVHIDWLSDAGKESVTVFAEFSGSTMAQQQSGDIGTKRTSQDCFAMSVFGRKADVALRSDSVCF